MGERGNGRLANVSNPEEKKEIIWIRLKTDSNLVFSTNHYGKQRVIYYSQKSLTKLHHYRKDR